MPNNPGGPPDMKDMKDMEEDRFRQRLLSMERESEWLRARIKVLSIGLLVALVLIAFGAVRQGIPGLRNEEITVETVQAAHFVLVDDQGNVRGDWRVDQDGNSRMGILDRRGRTRLSLSVLSSGAPGLSLINSNGRHRAALGLHEDESINLTLADGTGLSRAVLGLSTGDAASLVFADGNGTPRVALGLDEIGTAILSIPERLPEDASGQGGG